MSAGLTAEQRKWWEPIATGGRWLIFIPGGLLGGAVVQVLMLLVAGANWGWGVTINSILGGLLSAVVFGYMAVALAAYIAPTSNKAVPSTIQAIVVFVLFALASITCVNEREWLKLVQYVVVVVSAAVAARHSRTEWSSR